ncbi:phospholipase/carboxylesterase [Nocardioides exalbidus]|uniref:Phospholipase/carboxylesterase n=1 Tax=Nocardioides exalbidus TaxID=402596 RepID=A0A1H4PXV3_9ACTN|nr:alpha/beta fold hydrolase [Nocardioides exalbidus]SEC12104.1 phospholipase/carboxylesterase [Nocardioides exalbidus]
MPRHTLTEPVVAWSDGADHPDRPLVVLLHGRGADEHSILGLAAHLPREASYAAVRAPIGEGGGHAWFDNRGIGRPVPESLAETVAWFEAWLDAVAPTGRKVVLVGFSGGAAFAGGVLLTAPERLTGAAILHGTLPFEDAGVDVAPGRLAGSHVFVAQGDADHVIPRELLDRTWSWLAEDSAATVVSRREAGGHQLSTQTTDDLKGWLDELL